MNRTIRLLKRVMRAIGHRSPWRRVGPTHHHDLDALAGTWSAEDAAWFERALAAQRGIDPTVWD